MSPDFLIPAPVLPDSRPQLLVVVDTEEEFDWSAPLRRDSVSVTAVGEIGRLQRVLMPYGIKPTYVIDYPVASTPASAESLRETLEQGGCHIGAHLHPWVSPPYVEEVSPRTSYACNLGAELEREKIARLRNAIFEHLGVRPRIYKAGRYGFGSSTADILETLDFDIDVSVNPYMDYTSDGGPSFEGFEPTPSFFGRRRRLLEVPCTTGFIGVARRMGSSLRRAASMPWLEPFRAVGVLARAGILNRVMLSPEGSTYAEMRSLTDTLYRGGVRTFSLTFHSPSLKPGCTPYVRSLTQRDQLLQTIDRYCDYFIGILGGAPSTPCDLFDQLVKSRPA